MTYKAVHFTLALPSGSPAELLSMCYDLLSAEAGAIGFDSFEESGAGLTGYIPSELFDPDAIDRLPAMLPVEGLSLSWTSDDVADQDWNEEWERVGYEPIVIGHTLAIHDCQHPLPADASVAHEMIIDARQAFGTGTHETTRMICERLFGLGLEGKRVLDCGCGTGILSIASILAGAQSVVAYDIDDWSVRNTRHNIELNGVSGIEVLAGDRSVLSHVSGLFDVILANINRNVLLEDMPSFADVLQRGGTVLLSGFYDLDAPLLTTRAQELGWTLAGKRTDSDWCMLEFKG